MTGFKPIKGLILGEISITIMKYQVGSEYTMLEGLNPIIYATIPITATVGQLKQRIQGDTNLPVSRIRLMFCGSVLEDSEIIPFNAFEVTDKTTDDADVFRPRMFLTLKPVIDIEKIESTITVESEIDEEQLRLAREAKAAAEEALRKAEELREIHNARTRDLEEKLMMDHARPADFDLSSDLEKIGCSHFILPLLKAGFADEGAFSHITDDVLQESGLWIPRKARVRIVALSDSIKRRLEVRSHSRPGALIDIEKQMVTGNSTSKIHTRSIEGIDQNFTTKASITKAFENKKKEEQRAKSAELERKQKAEEDEKNKNNPKPHDAHTQSMIDAIRWRCELDEFGLPVHCYRPALPKFCCKKHEESSTERRLEYLKQRADTNLTDLMVNIHAADTITKGFISREALKHVAKKHVKSHNYPTLLMNDIERILNESLLSSEKQRIFETWGREIERKNNPVGSIPAPFYDSLVFASKFMTSLRMHDETRLAIDPIKFLQYSSK